MRNVDQAFGDLKFQPRQFVDHYRRNSEIGAFASDGSGGGDRQRRVGERLGRLADLQPDASGNRRSEATDLISVGDDEGRSARAGFAEQFDGLQQQRQMTVDFLLPAARKQDDRREGRGRTGEGSVRAGPGREAGGHGVADVTDGKFGIAPVVPLRFEGKDADGQIHRGGQDFGSPPAGGPYLGQHVIDDAGIPVGEGAVSPAHPAPDRLSEAKIEAAVVDEYDASRLTAFGFGERPEENVSESKEFPDNPQYPEHRNPGHIFQQCDAGLSQSRPSDSEKFRNSLTGGSGLPYFGH